MADKRVQERNVNRHSFEVKDRFNRVLGTNVITWEQHVSDPDTTWGNGVYLTPGVWFGLQVHSTRDAVAYGASQRPRFFATAAERGTAIIKYLDQAQKRAKANEGR